MDKFIAEYEVITIADCIWQHPEDGGLWKVHLGAVVKGNCTRGVVNYYQDPGDTENPPSVENIIKYLASEARVLNDFPTKREYIKWYGHKDPAIAAELYEILKREQAVVKSVFGKDGHIALRSLAYD